MQAWLIWLQSATDICSWWQLKYWAGRQREEIRPASITYGNTSRRLFAFFFQDLSFFITRMNYVEQLNTVPYLSEEVRLRFARLRWFAQDLTQNITTFLVIIFFCNKYLPCLVSCQTLLLRTFFLHQVIKMGLILYLFRFFSVVLIPWIGSE